MLACLLFVCAVDRWVWSVCSFACVRVRVHSCLYACVCISLRLFVAHLCRGLFFACSFDGLGVCVCVCSLVRLCARVVVWLRCVCVFVCFVCLMVCWLCACLVGQSFVSSLARLFDVLFVWV